MSKFYDITPEDIIGDTPPVVGPERSDDEKKSNWHFHVSIGGGEPGCIAVIPADTEEEAERAAIDDTVEFYLDENPDADLDYSYCTTDCEHDEGEHCEIRVFRMPDLPFHLIAKG